MKKLNLIISLLFTLALYGQEKNVPIRVMFYNVENLFHPQDDKGAMDGEYTPLGNKHWTYKKYNKKINSILKVFSTLGEWNMPCLIGLAEIENQKVLKDIIFKKGMRDYSFVHRESPDIRGIDVALLYRNSEFKLISQKFFNLHFSFNPKVKSREILYVKGIVRNADTLHVFVNHWPSRRNGSKVSEKKRFVAANILRAKIDSICTRNKSANIFIMGDFNDEPMNVAVRNVLKAGPYRHSNNDLVNMAYPLSQRGKGTYKYKNKWNMLDQIIVSPSLLKSRKGLFCKPGTMKIFMHPYILEDDKTYYGVKPFRTYRGPIYQGGVSDHLPVYLDLYLR